MSAKAPVGGHPYQWGRSAPSQLIGGESSSSDDRSPRAFEQTPSSDPRDIRRTHSPGRPKHALPVRRWPKFGTPLCSDTQGPTFAHRRSGRWPRRPTPARRHCVAIATRDAGRWPRNAWIDPESPKFVVGSPSMMTMSAGRRACRRRDRAGRSSVAGGRPGHCHLGRGDWRSGRAD